MNNTDYSYDLGYKRGYEAAEKKRKITLPLPSGDITLFVPHDGLTQDEWNRMMHWVKMLKAGLLSPAPPPADAPATG